MNKKGNFPDIAEWLGLALTLGIVIVFTLLWISNLTTNINTMNNSTIPQDAKTGINNLNEDLPTGLDLLFIAMYIIFVAFSVVMARIIPSSPLFIIITIMAIIILPFLSMIMANVWSGLAQQTSIGTILNTTPIMKFFMDKIVYFTLFYSIAVGIALLTKDELRGQI